MDAISLDELVKILNPLKILKPSIKVFKKVCIDSRKVGAGDVFLAFKGEFKDGHDFIEQAFKNGCALCISQKQVVYPHLLVKDSKEALRKIASKIREKSGSKVIAIVGSVGKTTTKQLLRAYFDKANMRCYSTVENENNYIGVSKTLLQANIGDDFGIIEVGTNHKGEIALIGEFLKPDFVIFTEIGTSHIGNFGSKEAILEEKTSIVDYLLNKNGVIFNKDNALLRNFFKDYGYGYSLFDKKACVHLKSISNLDFMNLVEISAFSKVLKISIPISINVSNVLAVITFLFLNNTLEESLLQEAMSSVVLPRYRMELEKLNSTHFIIDCYNASLESTKFALDVLSTRKGTKLAILGDILELGEFIQKIHEEIGNYTDKFDIDVIGYGKSAKYIVNAKKNNRGVFFLDKGELINKMKSIYSMYDFVLIKGSRGMKMEEIFYKLKEGV